MIILFFSVALGLAATAMLLLVRVLWHGPRTTSVERANVNIAVIRDQLAELERDVTHGTLSAKDYEQAKLDLQRRVLHEAKTDDTTLATATGDRRIAATLAVLLPAVAFALYLGLGSPEALTVHDKGRAPATRADAEAMVASLEKKLQRDPDNPEGWALLARSYRAFGRNDDAVMAFGRAGAIVDTDPQLLAEYADTLAKSRNGNLNGEPSRLVKRALSLNPSHPLALAIAGSDAFARRDFAGAIVYWQRLRSQLPPESEVAQTIEIDIETARSLADGKVQVPN